MSVNIINGSKRVLHNRCGTLLSKEKRKTSALMHKDTNDIHYIIVLFKACWVDKLIYTVFDLMILYEGILYWMLVNDAIECCKILLNTAGFLDVGGCCCMLNFWMLLNGWLRWLLTLCRDWLSKLPFFGFRNWYVVRNMLSWVHEKYFDAVAWKWYV